MVIIATHYYCCSCILVQAYNVASQLTTDGQKSANQTVCDMNSSG